MGIKLIDISEKQFVKIKNKSKSRRKKKGLLL